MIPTWAREGVALIWREDALARLCQPGKVASMRRFFEISRNWPDELPMDDGDTLVVAGLDNALELLDRSEIEAWGSLFRAKLAAFQDHYAGSAGLVFWVPAGEKRVQRDSVSRRILWRGGTKHKTFDLGLQLWGGAFGDVLEIEPNAGFYIKRIS